MTSWDWAFPVPESLHERADRYLERLDKVSALHVPVGPPPFEECCKYDGFTWPCLERRILDGDNRLE
jgi:hypothetical protein